MDLNPEFISKMNIAVWFLLYPSISDFADISHKSPMDLTVYLDFTTFPFNSSNPETTEIELSHDILYRQ